jgi:hypothetical protein
MRETYAYLHVDKQDAIPTMVELPESVSAKSKTDTALLALGLSETTTAIPRSMIVEFIESEDSFLYHKVVNRVQALIGRALELQEEIARIEATLAGRTVTETAHMTSTELAEEPWDYVEDITYEYPTRFDDNREWRELIVLTTAEKKLRDDIDKQEKRLVNLTAELKKREDIKPITELIVRQEITVDTQEGVA